MIVLDGSLGEGGGQVLRTALALSLVTGEPFVIERIRANRATPGLKRQHLTAVLAAAQIGGARVEGAELGSLRVAFRPDRVRPGDYEFTVSTAGSTTLVLQTLLPPLLVAKAPSSLQLSGGTHNPLAPPFEFVQRSFGRALTAMGAVFELHLVRHGFAPAGGGLVTASLTPAPLRPLDLRQHEAAGLPRARVLLANLSERIGERELRIVQRRLALPRDQCRIETVPSHGPGNMLLLEFPGAIVDEIVGVPGERRLSAAQVAQRAVEQAQAFLTANVPVGEHLADQLLIPMALAGGGVFRTLAPSLHTTTNMQTIERFLPARFQVHADDGGRTCTIEVRVR